MLMNIEFARQDWQILQYTNPTDLRSEGPVDILYSPKKSKPAWKLGVNDIEIIEFCLTLKQQLNEENNLTEMLRRHCPDT